MRFHCLQHVIFETPGLLSSWISQRGDSLRMTYFFGDGVLPSVEDFDVLIVMGGPMSVHDEAEFPWLRSEKALIAAAIGAGKKVLGICLGAQLIAEVMGGRVYPNPVKEIGFWPVRWTEEAGSGDGGVSSGDEEVGSGDEEVFHWHGETFDLPPGAVLLASSAGCVNQAFRVGENVLALQFHPEVTPEIIGDMIRFEGHELAEEGPFIGKAGEIAGRAKGIAGAAGTGNTGQLGLLLSAFLIN
jgi:GMP synthase-like glutamine amidotransferase